MERTELDTAFADISDEQLANLLSELVAEELTMWDAYELRESYIDALRDGCIGYRQLDRSALLNELVESYADRDVSELVKRSSKL